MARACAWCTHEFMFNLSSMQNRTRQKRVRSNYFPRHYTSRQPVIYSDVIDRSGKIMTSRMVLLTDESFFDQARLLTEVIIMSGSFMRKRLAMFILSLMLLASICQTIHGRPISKIPFHKTKYDGEWERLAFTKFLRISYLPHKPSVH